MLILFLNGNMKSLNVDQKSTEMLIDALKLNSGSSIKMSNIFLNKTMQLKANSRIEFDRKVTFNKQSIIEIDESSFIEFGKSVIIGICDKIKISQIESKRKVVLNENTVTSEIICGEKFKCSDWIEKFETNL